MPKITELPVASAVAAADSVVVVQGGVSKQATTATLLAAGAQNAPFVLYPSPELTWATPEISTAERAIAVAAGQRVWWIVPFGAPNPTALNGFAEGDIRFPAEPLVSPTADFSVTRVGSTRQFTFDATASTAPPPATITGYAWTFGDGASATGVTTSRTYLADGTYTATLTVTDTNGLTGTHSEQVIANADPTLFSDGFTGTNGVVITTRDADNGLGGYATVRPANVGTANKASILTNKLLMEPGAAVLYPTAQSYFDFKILLTGVYTNPLSISPFYADTNNLAGFTLLADGTFRATYKTTAAGYKTATGTLPAFLDGDEARVVWDSTLVGVGGLFGGYRIQLWRSGGMIAEHATASTHNGTFPVTSPNTGVRLSVANLTGGTTAQVDSLRFIQTAAA